MDSLSVLESSLNFPFNFGLLLWIGPLTWSKVNGSVTMVVFGLLGLHEPFFQVTKLGLEVIDIFSNLIDHYFIGPVAVVPMWAVPLDMLAIVLYTLA